MNANSKSDIKPCPFCGGTNTYILKDYCGNEICVMCEDCEAEGPNCFGTKNAIELWNKRK